MKTRSSSSRHRFIFLTTLALLSSSGVQPLVKDDQKSLSDHWVMKLRVNQADIAEQVAHKYGFRLIRQIGSLDGFFMIEPQKRYRRDVHKQLELVRKIEAHPLIESIRQEEILIRTKREITFELSKKRLERADSVQSNMKTTQLNDPLWPHMWYLNRHESNPDLPDMNVTAAWAQNITGKGVVASILCDGLEWNHPDISPNYDSRASIDLIGHDNDPMPSYYGSNELGTRCAGEVAAVANNSVCAVGVAFNARIGGIRLINYDMTDSVEASALGFNSDHIDIYVSLWGPPDNGQVLEGPGELVKKALKNGAERGRRNLGSIFLWASGNGGVNSDSCACDGYTNSIYTISVSSTTENGDKPSFLEECASNFAATYAYSGEKRIYTTDIRGRCTSDHKSSSAATSLAAGIIALALEANPKLTWRDVMYTIAVSSRPNVIRSNNYIVNKRGFKVSPRYGFGLMDAGRMVDVAKSWQSVPPMASCAFSNSSRKIYQYQNKSMEVVFITDACAKNANEVNFIEHVEVIFSIKTQIRGQLELFLTSPMGTRSQLLSKRQGDISNQGFTNWPFMSVHFWGEYPRGEWKLTVTTPWIFASYLGNVSIVIHGTKKQPINYEKFVQPDPQMKAVFDSINSESEPIENGNKKAGSWVLIGAVAIILILILLFAVYRSKKRTKWFIKATTKKENDFSNVDVEFLTDNGADNK